MTGDGKLTEKEIHQTIWATAVGAAFIGGGATLVFPFLPLYLLELGATPDNAALWNSVIVSGMFIVGALIMPVWGALADRLGMKKMILRSALCLSISYFLSYFAQSPLHLLLARLFQGFSFGFNPVSQALLAEISGIHAGSAIGTLVGGRAAGTMLGPFLGGILGSLVGLRLPFLIAGIGDLGAFLLVLVLVKEPDVKRNKKNKEGIITSFHKLSGNDKFLTLIGLIIINQCAMLIINPLISLHVIELTGTSEHAAFISGMICGASGIAGVLGGPFWGKRGEKWGFKKVMVLSFAGAGLFSLMQYLAPSVLFFGITQFGFGFFTIGGVTSITGAVSKVVHPEEAGSAYGINAAAMNIGNCLGPLLGGMIASQTGSLGLVFVSSAFLQLAASVYIYIKVKEL
ncbi:MFS transporter [uncultured Dialister sp.]|uniref:MFS transporter n=1 Tax=uncultured Dialister sp. TaxID=278064 RepID=UPI0025EF8BD2|nr:MFS transporter [uncultured Dialister sp.]